MKIVGIGDLFIPKDYINAGFDSLKEYGADISTIDWEVKDFNELQNINLLIEKEGSDAIEPADYIYKFVEDADIILTQFCPITKKLIDNCKKLKVIGVFRGGYENVNIEYAAQKNILVFNTPGRNSDSVADFTVGMIISECRNISRGHFGLKNGVWIRQYPNSNYIPDLPGKTVGIIGLGEIGKKVAKRLKGFDVNIIGYDPYIKENHIGIKMVDLDYLMKESDFVTLHARLTKENENLISTKEIGLMKKTSYIINTSRAGLIDESALYNALKNKNIAGAALDVFNIEPPGKDYPLVNLENVTITPHMAGGSTDAFLNSPQKLAREMKKLWSEEDPGYIVNKETYKINKRLYAFGRDV